MTTTSFRRNLQSERSPRRCLPDLRSAECRALHPFWLQPGAHATSRCQEASQMTRSEAPRGQGPQVADGFFQTRHEVVRLLGSRSYVRRPSVVLRQWTATSAAHATANPVKSDRVGEADTAKRQPTHRGSRCPHRPLCPARPRSGGGIYQDRTARALLAFPHEPRVLAAVGQALKLCAMRMGANPSKVKAKWPKRCRL